MPRKTLANEPIELKLRKFDMSWIGDGKKLIYIGKTGSGKSVLVLDYLYHHQDFPIGTVISPTDEYNQTFRPHVPSLLIHDEFTPELLSQVLQRQKEITAKRNNDPAYKNIDTRAFLILDDCLADIKDWGRNKDIQWIFFNGRHVGLTMIITMQYSLGILPNLRNNVQYIFLSKNAKLAEQKRLYEHYAGIFPSFDMFRQVFLQCTKDYGCMVIDNDSQSDKIEDQVFWYRADIASKPDWETFKLCYPVFWKNNDRYTEKSSEVKREMDGDIDYNSVKKNKILVKKTDM